MIWLWLWLAVTQPTFNYPPDGVILLQDHGTVKLRWNLRGSSYRLEVWEDSRSVFSQTVLSQEQPVTLHRGQPVRWQVTNAQGARFSSEFSVAETAEFHLDGKPGLPIQKNYRGLGGTGGGSLRCRLSRDEAGMHLILWHPGGRNHYLFAQPGLRFKLTARGGEGARGRDGQDAKDYVADGEEPEPGVDGTDGGNGGRILISTGSSPWRDFLEVDVSSGKGGRGGRGGLRVGSRDERAPDGHHGRDGFPGRVETLIKDGW